MREKQSVLDVLNELLPQYLKDARVFLLKHRVLWNLFRGEVTFFGVILAVTMLLSALVTARDSSYWLTIPLVSVTSFGLVLYVLWRRRVLSRQYEQLDSAYNDRFSDAIKDPRIKWRWLAISNIAYAKDHILIVLVHASGTVCSKLVWPDEVKEMWRFLKENNVGQALPILKTSGVTFCEPSQITTDFSNLLQALEAATGWHFEYAIPPKELYDSARVYFSDHPEIVGAR